MGPAARARKAQRQPVTAAVSGIAWIVTMVSRNPAGQRGNYRRSGEPHGHGQHRTKAMSPRCTSGLRT